jgi:hypothetical protein
MLPSLYDGRHGRLYSIFLTLAHELAVKNISPGFIMAFLSMSLLLILLLALSGLSNSILIPGPDNEHP